MIEELADMPPGVIGLRVCGRLSGADLRAIKPDLAERLTTARDTARGIRIVEVIDTDYEGFGPGGLVEDIKLGLGTVLPHRSAFTKIAVVTDKEWVVHTLHALAWMVPGDLKVFGLGELEQATRWAAG